MGSHDWAVAGLPKLRLVFSLDPRQLWLPSPWSSVSQSGTAVHVQWQCGGDYMEGFVLKLKVNVSLSETADPFLKFKRKKRFTGCFCFLNIV